MVSCDNTRLMFIPLDGKTTVLLLGCWDERPIMEGAFNPKRLQFAMDSLVLEQHDFPPRSKKRMKMDSEYHVRLAKKVSSRQYGKPSKVVNSADPGSVARYWVAKELSVLFQIVLS